MKILAVSPEIFPLIKTGGLADVAGALPGALGALGGEVKTLVPGYPAVMKATKSGNKIAQIDDLFGASANLVGARVKGLELIIIDAPHLYQREGGPYGDSAGNDWPDNWKRFGALGKVAAMINNSCGDKPAVIVMSACYSGQFVPVLARDSRIVITAARPDRTSFGCGELDQLTYFDDCFLRAMPKAEDFAGLGGLVQQCVTFREKQMKAEPPSEPQVSVGPQVAFTLRWK